MKYFKSFFTFFGTVLTYLFGYIVTFIFKFWLHITNSGNYGVDNNPQCEIVIEKEYLYCYFSGLRTKTKITEVYKINISKQDKNYFCKINDYDFGCFIEDKEFNKLLDLCNTYNIKVENNS